MSWKVQLVPSSSLARCNTRRSAQYVRGRDRPRSVRQTGSSGLGVPHRSKYLARRSNASGEAGTAVSSRAPLETTQIRRSPQSTCSPHIPNSSPARAPEETANSSSARSRSCVIAANRPTHAVSGIDRGDRWGCFCRIGARRSRVRGSSGLLCWILRRSGDAGTGFTSGPRP